MQNEDENKSERRLIEDQQSENSFMEEQEPGE